MIFKLVSNKINRRVPLFVIFHWEKSYFNGNILLIQYYQACSILFITFSVAKKCPCWIIDRLRFVQLYFFIIIDRLRFVQLYFFIINIKYLKFFLNVIGTLYCTLSKFYTRWFNQYIGIINIFIYTGTVFTFGFVHYWNDLALGSK